MAEPQWSRVQGSYHRHEEKKEEQDVSTDSDTDSTLGSYFSDKTLCVDALADSASTISLSGEPTPSGGETSFSQEEGMFRLNDCGICYEKVKLPLTQFGIICTNDRCNDSLGMVYHPHCLELYTQTTSVYEWPPKCLYCFSAMDTQGKCMDFGKFDPDCYVFCNYVGIRNNRWEQKQAMKRVKKLKGLEQYVHARSLSKRQFSYPIGFARFKTAGHARDAMERAKTIHPGLYLTFCRNAAKTRVEMITRGLLEPSKRSRVRKSVMKEFEKKQNNDALPRKQKHSKVGRQIRLRPSNAVDL